MRDGRGGFKQFGRSFGGFNGKSFGDDATVTLAIGQRAPELQSSRPSSWAGPPHYVTPAAAYYSRQTTRNLQTPCPTSYLSDVDERGVNSTNYLSSKTPTGQTPLIN